VAMTQPSREADYKAALHWLQHENAALREKLGDGASVRKG